MSSLSGGEQPLVLALFPFQRVLVSRKPCLHRRAQRGLAPKARREGDVADLDAEAAPQLGERAQLIQLAQAVEPIPGRAPARNDQPRPLEERSIRADQPVRPAASLTVIVSTRGTLTQVCQASVVPSRP